MESYIAKSKLRSSPAVRSGPVTPAYRARSERFPTMEESPGGDTAEWLPATVLILTLPEVDPVTFEVVALLVESDVALFITLSGLDAFAMDELCGDCPPEVVKLTLRLDN
mmetsp:Transcript_23921/g.49530  ORF Transcript_23921/g.49530 Transcript_23921/m.49530 type:complete len:110 (+) Transcript_23921:761-1090(+)